MGMHWTRSLALAAALSVGATGCGGKQLTNKQVATGVIAVAAVVGIVVLLSLQCNELTEQCD